MLADVYFQLLRMTYLFKVELVTVRLYLAMTDRQQVGGGKCDD